MGVRPGVRPETNTVATPLLRVLSDPEADGGPVPPSFDDIFRAHASFVLGIGLRLLGRRDEADDLVQEVFIAAYRARHKLRELAAARRWLAVVATRKARRALRMRWLRRWMSGSASEAEALPFPGLSPEEVALFREVQAALDALPTSQRIAWALHRLQGESLPEAARLCGCSLAT